MDSNTNESYASTGNEMEVTYVPGVGFVEPRIIKHKIDLLLPNEIKKQNVTNFRLLIFANNSYSESNLEIYPFDYIDTFMLLDFPSNSNVNIMVEIPKELNSYEISSSVFEKNKENPDEKSPPISLRNVYRGTYSISSDNNVNFEKNYTGIEIKVNRARFSIEKLSFYAIILFSVLLIIYLYFKGQKGNNLIEIISFYIGSISIPFAIYLNNRPNISSGLTIFEKFYIILVVVIVLIVGLILWKKKKENEYFGEY